ncbi:hypothetical protein AVEN_52634-1 [Araneus ventricosus]|uniref:Uncharacterized protein n=1 Tax=Araneus ventricosus TaxID=182803 RepID=A0A4Y2SHX8_ARAVE|nr:hypothetical protein AVEN_52634-1 [Araneus ventricosus]
MQVLRVLALATWRYFKKVYQLLDFNLSKLWGYQPQQHGAAIVCEVRVTKRSRTERRRRGGMKDVDVFSNEDDATSQDGFSLRRAIVRISLRNDEFADGSYITTSCGHQDVTRILIAKDERII